MTLHVAFHATNSFLFSRHHIPTNGVAPLSAYKPAHWLLIVNLALIGVIRKIKNFCTAFHLFGRTEQTNTHTQKWCHLLFGVREFPLENRTFGPQM